MKSMKNGTVITLSSYHLDVSRNRRNCRIKILMLGLERLTCNFGPRLLAVCKLFSVCASKTFRGFKFLINVDQNPKLTQNIRGTKKHLSASEEQSPAACSTQLKLQAPSGNSVAL